MNVYVMSRDRAVKYCGKHHDTPSAIISIATPHALYRDFVYKNTKNNVKDILEMTFADADAPNTPDVYGTIVSEEDLLSAEQVKQIVEFVKKNKNYDIIVHCDAGISRSSGVAAAILKYYTGDDSQIFDSRWFAPNMWCYRKVLEGFIYKDELLEGS